MGEIILWTGPHLGVTHDATIWNSTWDVHPMYWWEYWLADLGYIGCLGLLVKFVQRHLPWPMTRRQKLYNNLQEFYRNRVEQIVSVVKAHRIFKRGVYQGNFEQLEMVLTLVGHVTALELRMFGPRFQTCGPWRHAY